MRALWYLSFLEIAAQVGKGCLLCGLKRGGAILHLLSADGLLTSLALLICSRSTLLCPAPRVGGAGTVYPISPRRMSRIGHMLTSVCPGHTVSGRRQHGRSSRRSMWVAFTLVMIGNLPRPREIYLSEVHARCCTVALVGGSASSR